MSLEPKSILVVDVDYLGDVMLAAPVLPVLRRRFPHARLTLAASPEIAPLFSAHPALDEVVALDARRRFDSMLHLVQQLRRLDRHEVVVGLSANPARNWVAVLATWFCGAQRRLKVAPDLEGQPPQHWSAVYCNVLRPLDIQDSPDVQRLPLPTWARQKVQRSLFAHCSGRPWIGVNPGGRFYRVSDLPARKSIISRRWPVERFASLVRRLVNKGATVFLTGSKEEASLGATIAKLTGETDRVVNTMGWFSLVENAAVIERMDAFVSSDTGSMHLAVALDVPTVEIFGPSDPRRVGPLAQGTGHQVLQPFLPCSPCAGREFSSCSNPEGQECLNAIDVDTAYRAVHRALASRNSAPAFAG